MCCGVNNHLHKNGMFQTHQEIKPRLLKDIVIGDLLYTVFLYLDIYSKNKYELSHMYL